MKTILLLRHAKSSWSNPSLTDHERPLKKRGLRDAPMMGKLLKSQDLLPDLIISSSAIRALMTAELVAESCGYGGQVVASPALYHAEPESYVEAMQQAGDGHEVLLIVGHNPGLEDLLEQLVGQWRRMPTAALAEVRLDIDDWADLTLEGEGELTNLWLPREVRP